QAFNFLQDLSTESAIQHEFLINDLSARVTEAARNMSAAESRELFRSLPGTFRAEAEKIEQIASGLEELEAWAKELESEYLEHKEELERIQREVEAGNIAFDEFELVHLIELNIADAIQKFRVAAFTVNRGVGLGRILSLMRTNLAQRYEAIGSLDNLVAGRVSANVLEQELGDQLTSSMAELERKLEAQKAALQAALEEMARAQAEVASE
ncbi:MAG: hypothetical protein AAF202_08530, partial [Pseudomonadota bacterium]